MELYPRRLGVRCVPVRLSVVLSYGSFDNSGRSKTVDGTGRRRGEQRDHLLDRAEDGAAWVYSSQRVLHRCLCVQHPFVGEEQLLINEKGHRYR